MNKLKFIIIVNLILLSSGCAVNGKHTYINGNCISCWNNPVTQETIDYETAGANNYFRLTWHELMLEGLSQYAKGNNSLYGEDYLRSQLGLKAVSLKNNEITYRREIHRYTLKLNEKLKKHKISPAYQITASSMLGKYDFDKNEFPVRHYRDIKLQGDNNFKNLPKKITVHFTNSSDFPNFMINPDQAERFLERRRNSKGIYIRYIVENLKMNSAGSFDARVKEIQYINVKPSIVTRNNSEKYQPISVYKL